MMNGPRSAPNTALTSRRGNRFRLAAFVLLVTGTGFLIGWLNIPGAWYATLNKPPFNPPDWVFAPVWTALFVLIGVAGFRTFSRQPRGTEMILWTLQMALNFTWSPIFFSLHRIDFALAVILALFFTILAFVWRQWRVDQTAALLFIPYAAWVGFAAVLNASLFLLN
jgi:tryptophan-rich sensory protein